MSYDIRTEKLIRKSPHDVFAALKGGLLFLNCGSDSNTIKIDFRVGGQYQLDFKSHGAKNHGEFVEIIPDRKIVFTWCQAFGVDAKPDTTVTIELTPEGSSTRLVLKHTGFKDQAVCDDHTKGWTTGLNDMTTEIENGQLRMLRAFPVSAEKLFAACENPAMFFAHMGDVSKGKVDFKVGGKYDVPNENGGVRGEFLEIQPAKKIKLSWLGGCGDIAKDSAVTILIHERPKGSAMELVHNGLLDLESQMSHRQGWEHVTSMMKENLS